MTNFTTRKQIKEKKNRNLFLATYSNFGGGGGESTQFYLGRYCTAVPTHHALNEHIICMSNILIVYSMNGRFL